ncbi:ABC transporter substrate-binding protein [Endozoicomonas sp. Mp262]|uniref:ABC transporter substrate-binding protein n=1 Tax=Endozoicomonas sp. Mp262 TaxID=2919499 RepID=UPI0021DB39D9
MKAWMLLFSCCLITPTSLSAKESPVQKNTLHLGSVLALKGKAKGLGTGMKNGLNASLNGQTINGRKINIHYKNDFYEPDTASQATTKLIKRGIFLMIGNVGTPTAKVTLPLLAKANIPAVGFFTGAGLLRPAPGPIVNYRASYVQETAAVINDAVKNGLNPESICAYVQNDAYGMAGLTGIRQAFAGLGVSQTLLMTLDKIIAMEGNNPARNNVGPVGVYKRNTANVRFGYQSLKAWEKSTGNSCRLVVTVGAYGNISHFVRVANRDKKENWIISAVSFTGADNYSDALNKFGATDKIIMTQVVPLLDSDLPIVKEARTAMGTQFGFVSLEGYIVGKLTRTILEATPEPLNHDNFLAQVKKTKINLGGLPIDFTKNPIQGSDLVITSYLTDTGYSRVDKDVWKKWLATQEK